MAVTQTQGRERLVRRVVRFTGNGTWTVPAGVTYAVAHMLGGGGGSGLAQTAGNGASSTVAFSAGTVQSRGGIRIHYSNDTNSGPTGRVGLANTGKAANIGYTGGNRDHMMGRHAGDSQYVSSGAVVTPGQNISVAIGAGGSAGTSGAAGGSGYVWIEFYEPVRD